MRRAVRAIIIDKERLLVMHRNKFGVEYETLPGGNIEVGESVHDALVREVHEETMVKFEDPRLVIIEHAGDPYGDQYIFLCKYVSGEPELAPYAEERVINNMGKNLYQPGWVNLTDLQNLPFLSTELRDKILKYSEHGWPQGAVEITTN